MNILLSLLLVVSVSLSIYFVDKGFNFFMVVPFGSLLLTLLLAFIFSEKNQKTARLVFLVLYLIVFSFFTYSSINSYVNVATCERYEDYSCLARKAVKEDDSSLCDSARDDGAPSESRRGWCYRELSKNWKDDSICENLKIGDVSRYFGDYYRCIRNIAKNTGNSSICEKLDYDERFSPNKKECYKALGQEPPATSS